MTKYDNDPVVIRDLLHTRATWAVVGLSTNRHGPPTRSPSSSRCELGMRIVPVHPRAETVFGAAGYATLADIPDGTASTSSTASSTRRRSVPSSTRRSPRRTASASRRSGSSSASSTSRPPPARARPGWPSSWTPARGSSTRASSRATAPARSPASRPGGAVAQGAPLAIAASRSSAWKLDHGRPDPRRLLALARAEDAGRQQPGVAGAADRHRRHRDAGRHLHDRQQRVHPVEVLQRHRHPDDRQRRDRRRACPAGGPRRRRRR